VRRTDSGTEECEPRLVQLDTVEIESLALREAEVSRRQASQGERTARKH